MGEKIHIGDFEGDLVIGKNHKEVLATLADRHSWVNLTILPKFVF